MPDVHEFVTPIYIYVCISIRNGLGEVLCVLVIDCFCSDCCGGGGRDYC